MKESEIVINIQDKIILLNGSKLNWGLFREKEPDFVFPTDCLMIRLNADSVRYYGNKGSHTVPMSLVNTKTQEQYMRILKNAAKDFVRNVTKPKKTTTKKASSTGRQPKKTATKKTPSKSVAKKARTKRAAKKA